MTRPFKPAKVIAHHIENTRRIEAVIVGGRVIDRAQRDAMLESVRQANDRSRSVSVE